MYQLKPIISILFLSFLYFFAKAQDYYLYVAAESEDEVYLIHFDGQTAKIAQTIPVGYMPTEIEGPHGLTIGPDGKYWYLTMAHGIPNGKLYKFTTGDNQLIAETELGVFPASMQISSANGLLFVVNFNLHGKMLPSSVSVVDPEDMFELKRIQTGTMPHGSRISPDGRYQYSVAMMSGELYEINTLDLKVSRKISLEKTLSMGAISGNHTAHVSSAEGKHQHSEVKPTWVIPHPTSSALYIAGNGSNELLEVDRESWTVTHRLPTGKGPYNVEVTPDGKKVVVTYKSEGKTAIWSTKSRKELARIDNSRKVSHGIAISTDSRYAFISVEGIGAEAGSVDVIDLKKLKRVAVVEVGKQAGGIVFWKME